MSSHNFEQQITFLHSSNLGKTLQFYKNILDLKLARDQGSCLIFEVTETAYLGFCEHIEQINPGRKIILTLVCKDVDSWFKTITEKGAAVIEPPKANPKFHIYHFFLEDPDGYWIEIQRFDNPL